MPTTASGKAEQAGDSASLEWLARAGLIAYGGVHLLIAFTYPVVPHGEARIRTQVSAAHTEADLERAATAFAEARDELGS